MKHSAWRTFVESRQPQSKNPKPRYNQGAAPLTDKELEALHLLSLEATRVMGDWPSGADDDWRLIREANPRRLTALLDELRTLRAKEATRQDQGRSLGFVEEIVEKARTGEWSYFQAVFAIHLLFPRPLTQRDIDRTLELAREHGWESDGSSTDDREG